MLLLGVVQAQESLNESFDSGKKPPTGWKHVLSSGNTRGWIPVKSSSHSISSPHTGSYFIEFESYSTRKEKTAELYTPLLDLTQGTKTLTFYTVVTSGSNGLHVDVSKDGGKNWNENVLQIEKSAKETKWTEHSLDLASYSSSNKVQVRFRASSSYGSGKCSIGLDDVSGPKLYVSKEAPIAASGEKPASEAKNQDKVINLSWDKVPFATGYKFSLGTDKAASNLLTDQDLKNVNSFTTAQLDYTTTYYWKVTPYNSYGEASDAPVWSFTTMADPTVTSFPWAEGFEESTFPPAGWKTIDNNKDGKTWISSTSSYAKHSGSKGVKVSYASTKDELLITPPINVQENCFFEFYAKGSSYSKYSISVKVSETGNQYDDFSTVKLDQNLSGGFEKYTVDLSTYKGKTVYLAFAAIGKNSPYLDDVKIYVPKNMEIKSIVCSQANTSEASIGAANTEILKMEVLAEGKLTSMNVSQLKFATEGTSALSDLSGAKVYFTGSKDQFSKETLFGSVTTVNSNFEINGKQKLTEGKNYFWLCYDISSKAVEDHTIDASFTELIAGGNKYTSATNQPDGNRVLKNMFRFVNGESSCVVKGSKKFYDDGGLEKNCSKDFEGTVTFLPADVSKKIQIEFSKFEIFNTSSTGYNDIFQVYNGNKKDDKNLIGTYSTLPDVLKSSAANGALTVYFKVKTGNPKAGWDATVSEITPQSMTYLSSNTVHPTKEKLSAGDKNQQILRIEIATDHTENPLKISKLKLGLGASTKASDISAAKVYFTGNTSEFSTKELFGEINNPTTDFIITGDQSLKYGKNYFWLVYDIANAAVNNDLIDAVCNSVFIAGVEKIPTITSPEGNRKVDNTYEMPKRGTHTKTVGASFNFTDDNGNIGGKYSNDAMSTVTFKPANDGEKVRLTFSEFRVFIQKASYGTKAVFRVYNGSKENAGQLIYEATHEDCLVGPALPLTSSTDDGCLTVKFVGNAYTSSQTEKGWVAKVESFVPSPMVYKICNLSQITEVVKPGSVDQAILACEIQTEGMLNPIENFKMTFSTKGTTKPAEINKAKLYTTGRSSEFKTTTLVGEAVENPNGTFSFDIAHTLIEGSNYFWLTYDTKSSATPDHVLDAECLKVTIAGKDHVLKNSTVSGARTIKKIFLLKEGSFEEIVNEMPTLFYDDGGISRKYSKDYTGIVVFVPEDKNQKVRLEIPYMDISTMENFYVCNGASTSPDDQIIKMDDENNISKEDPAYVFKSTSEDGKLCVKFNSTKWSTPKNGWEAKVTSFTPQPVYYESSMQTASSNEAVLKSEKGANILKLALRFKGETTPAKVTSINFSTEGTTNVSDIAAAKLYYTGKSDKFNQLSATEFGEIIPSPSGDIQFTDGVSILAEDTYYFWLVYDIAANANAGNYVKAICKQITINSKNYIPDTPESIRGRQVKSGFHGTYTIGEGGNYKNFTTAIEALKVGVDGPVTFKVKPGVYQEQIKIPEIQGASATNTITFESETGNADDVKITYDRYIDPGYGNPKFGVITITGGDYIHFKNMSITTINKSMVALVYIRDNSTDLIFEGNKFTAPYTTSYKGVVCIKTKESKQAHKNNDRLQLLNNTVIGGYYGFSIAGTGYVNLPKEKGHVIKGNRIENQAGKAIWFSSISDGKIQNNIVINKVSTKNNFSAIEIYRPKGNTIVSENIVRVDVNVRDAKGIYIRDAVGTKTNKIKLINNAVCTASSQTGAVGIGLYKSEFIDCYHNTVKMSGTGLSKGAFCTEKMNNYAYVKNNNFVNVSKGPAIYTRSADDLTLVNFDYNNLYSNSANLVIAGTSEMADLSAWQSPERGAHSISEETVFYSTTDLHVKTLGNLNQGVEGLGVTKDIDGEDRDTKHPTIGADEFKAPSVVPPAFIATYPKLLSTTHQSARLTAKINQNGKLFYVVLAKDAAIPSVAQVKAGKASDNSVLEEGKFGSCELIKDQEENFVFSKLIAHTEYNAYVVAEDNLGNCMPNVAKVLFKTKYKPTQVSTFEKIAAGTTSFDDGTAHFKGFTVTTGEGVLKSKQFAAVAPNTNASVTILNTDTGIVLDGFFLKSSSNVQITGIRKDGSKTSILTILPTTSYSFVNLRDLGSIVSLQFTANPDGFEIDNFSGAPLELKLDLPKEVNVKDGQKVKVEPKITGGVKPYQYQWTPQKGIFSTTVEKPNFSPATTTRYTLKVTDKYGKTVSDEVLVKVISSTTKTADFEEIALKPEHFLMGDLLHENSFYYSGSYQFNNFYAPSYMTWSGFGISNETSTDFDASKFLVHQFRNAVGGGLNKEGNYAVVYAFGFVPEITLNNGKEEDLVKGMYITNSAYTLNSIENGDSFVGDAFKQGDFYKTTITGYDKNGDETNSIEVYLADYRSSNPKDHFVLKDWKWIDLSSLGKVKTVKFKVSGSRNNSRGLLTPGYFCIDNFNSDKIDFAPKVKQAISDITVDEDAAKTEIDLSSLFTDSDNDDAKIEKSILAPSSSSLISVALKDNKLTINYQANQHGNDQIIIQGKSNGKTVDASFKVNVNPVDDAPYVKKSINNIVVKEDAADFEVDLQNLFSDIDNEDRDIKISLKNNSNSDLLSAKMKDKKLLISLVKNKFGESQITLIGNSNGKTIEFTFTIRVNSVDDHLIVNEPISNVTVLEDAADYHIDLKNVFKDIDNPTAKIAKTIVSKPNRDLCSASIQENDLTLHFCNNAFGESEITIQGELNGFTTTTSFKVNVKAVDDAPIVSNKIADRTVEVNTVLKAIDLTSVFSDIDNDKFTYAFEIENKKLLSASVDGKALKLKLVKDQYGKSTVKVKAFSGGKEVETFFVVTVNKPLAGPKMLKQIQNINAAIGTVDRVINLSDYFSCEDGNMNFTIVNNTDDKLIKAEIVADELRISFIGDMQGSATLTIEANANGKTIQTSFVIALNQITGIDDLQKDEIKVYPNPCTEYFWINMDQYSEEVQVSIIDITGHILFQEQLQRANRKQISVQHLPTGMYFVRIQTSKNTVVKKIIKK
jgi:hypothetical protein